MMMPTQTSLRLQMLRSMASHIISVERRNLCVMGILATERPVPLLLVSTFFSSYVYMNAYTRVSRKTTLTPHCVCLLSCTCLR